MIRTLLGSLAKKPDDFGIGANVFYRRSFRKPIPVIYFRTENGRSEVQLPSKRGTNETFWVKTEKLSVKP